MSRDHEVIMNPSGPDGTVRTRSQNGKDMGRCGFIGLKVMKPRRSSTVSRDHHGGNGSLTHPSDVEERTDRAPFLSSLYSAT